MLVTSFLLQRNGSSTHPADTYFLQFKRMRSCVESNIILFLDKSIDPSLFTSEKTLVIPTSIEETQAFKIIEELKNPIINIADNPIKNTKDYHIIINSKTEFMERALSLTQDQILAWVDFGIGNVISQDNSFKKIDNIDKFSDGLYIPGCWSLKNNSLNCPSWRFCGGFFFGDRNSIKNMHLLSQKVIQEKLPQITWEVNIWSIMESDYNFPFNWYKGDHNDTIFNF